jgi:hypothetical protein
MAEECGVFGYTGSMDTQHDYAIDAIEALLTAAPGFGLPVSQASYFFGYVHACVKLGVITEHEHNGFVDRICAIHP